MTDVENKEEISSTGVQRGGDPADVKNYLGSRVVVNIHIT